MINLKGFINKDMAKDPNKLFDLQIDTIENDLLVQGNKYKMILKVSPINGELLNSEALEQITQALQGALSSFGERKGIYILSKYTLGTYLVSYIFDVVLYYIVKHIFNNIAGLSLVLPFTILVNLILSTLTSFFITEISEKLYKVISKKMLD